MSKTIDKYFVDPESGAFQWVMSLLEGDLNEVTDAIFRDGTDQSATEKLRGRRVQIERLKKKLKEAY